MLPLCLAAGLTTAAAPAPAAPPLQARSPTHCQARQHTATPSRSRSMALVASASAAPASTSTEQQAEPSQHIEAQQALPATYRRLVARRTGGSFREVAEVQEGVPLPQPQEGEVLVRVHYAGE